MRDRKVSEEQIRAYAAGELAWATLRRADVLYEDVLAGLGEFGLRPPFAPMEGPNRETRERGIRLLRELLEQQAV